MQLRISQWEKAGGKRDMLREAVKNAEKREGVVVLASTVNGPNKYPNGTRMEERKIDTPGAASKRKTGWETARLNAQLEEVVRERETVKREMDMVLWREKVINLAIQHTEKGDTCGWDQRLCVGEEEWADYGVEVLESYDEERAGSGDDAMQVDGTPPSYGGWWCTGKKKCERHAG